MDSSSTRTDMSILSHPELGKTRGWDGGREVDMCRLPLAPGRDMFENAFKSDDSRLSGRIRLDGFLHRVEIVALLPCCVAG